MSRLEPDFRPVLAQAAELAGDDVHVWLVDLNPGDEQIRAYRETLSADEHERAERFYFERDRRRFVVARGALRAIVGGYLRIEPAALEFEYGGRGKPAIAARVGRPLAFNVSHSGELALIACSPCGDLGVDIEEMRLLDDADEIAAQFFSEREVATLRSLPSGSRNEAFFRCWTRKEAYVKAVGDGLSRPLDAFDVTFAPGDAAALTIGGDDDDTRHWALYALDVPRGYAGALVTDGPRRVSGWRYAPAVDYQEQMI
ncbi:MAG TPA: 4'-phosphopantetheinyl transferase superfamily protein [Vicinamibacterales bacterium]